MGARPDVLYSFLSLDLSSLVPDAAADLHSWRTKAGSGPVCSESGVRRFAARALLASSLKKWEDPADARTAEADSWSKFKTANQKSYLWKRPKTCDLAVGYVVEEARHLLYKWAGDVFSMAEISRAARFGPGRSKGSTCQFTSTYFKVGADRLTCTRDFIRSWYESDCSSNPTCLAAEEGRRLRQGAAVTDPVGKLSFVPKSWDAKRSILIEPSLNTYYQLGLGSLLEKILQRQTGIDFSLQKDRNAELARQGSIDGRYATVDLKQCSDYISVALCRWLLPPDLFRWLTILRTHQAKYRDEREIPLGMIGTMGNGFTFPLMTLIMTSLCLACYRVLDIPICRPTSRRAGTWSHKGAETSVTRLNDGNFGVFGDDVVLSAEAFELFCKACEHLGLIVNKDKSYSVGPFRESCGSDWYNGVDVRGIYIRSLASKQDYYSAFNRLAAWSAKHSIALPRTLDYLLLLVGQKVLVPPDEGVVCGIIVPKPLPEHETSDGFVYSCLRLKPPVLKFNPFDEVVNGGLIVGPRKWLLALKGQRDLNDHAVLKVLLAGSLRRLIDTPRVSTLRSRIEQSTSIRWGWHCSGLLPAPGSREFDDWNIIVVDCLLRNLLL